MILHNISSYSAIIFGCIVTFLFSLGTQAQIQFEPIIPPPPAPQNIADFVAISNGSVSYADIDGDMDQDVLIIGDTDFGVTSKLYSNDGNGNFTEVENSPLIATRNGSSAFADIDGDLDQDVLITGTTGSGPFSYTKLYTNDGNGNFSLVENTIFTGVEQSSIAFADIDGDSDQDVLITGYMTNFESPSIRLYLNDGNGNYSSGLSSVFLPSVDGSMAFTDIDGDLDQDILITGINGSIARSRLYINDGTGIFTHVSNTPFTNVSQSDIAFADIDGDLDQDVLITGSTYQGGIAELYINDGVGNYTLMANTPFNGVRFGSVAFADIDGDLDQDVMITGAGNYDSEVIAELYTNDGNGNFSLVNNTPFTGVHHGSVAFVDIDGDMDKDILITGDPNFYDHLSELYINDGSGIFSKAKNSRFSGVHDCGLAFADIDGDMDQDVLITGDSNSDPIAELYINDGTGNFSLMANTPFTEIGRSAVAFADIDGDFDQDVLIAGYRGFNDYITELYINDGSGNFSIASNTPFPPVYYGTIRFADMDGDLDLDILIAGRTYNFGRIANVYTNDGNGNFSLMVNMPFTDAQVSDMVVADFDGDMNIDVLVTGSTYSGKLTELYINDGTGNLTQLEDTPFTDVSGLNSIAVADIDGDMDQDVLIVGQVEVGTIAKLYTNDGNGNFVFVPNTPFATVSASFVAFEDIDGDMDQDILISGSESYLSNITEIYTNDGNGNFSLVDYTIHPAVRYGDVAFADIDGDSDKDVLIAGISPTGLISKLYRNTSQPVCPITALCKNITLPLDSTGNSILQPSDIDNGSTVTCGTPILSISQSTFTCADIGIHTIELTVADEYGSFEVCTAEVTVTAGAACADCEGVINGNAQPGSLCDQDGEIGIYSSDCICEISDQGSMAGHVSGLLNCGVRNVTIASYNQFYPEVNDVFEITIDLNGEFTTPSIMVGTYDILITVEGYLSKLYPDVILESGINNLEISGIFAGDLNHSNSVNVFDISSFSTAFGSMEGGSNYNFFADFNCNSIVNVFDVSYLNISFGMVGDNPY